MFVRGPPAEEPSWGYVVPLRNAKGYIDAMEITLHIVLYGAWVVFCVAGLLPARIAIHSLVAALVIGFVFLCGPANQPGAGDFRGYVHHPYFQPGLGMTLIAGGLLALRLWRRKRKQLKSSLARRRFELVTIVVVGIGAAVVFYERHPRVPAVLARIRAAGMATPDDLNRLMLAVWHDYPAYGHAEGELSGDYRFAPGLCRPPGGPEGRISESRDGKTHGAKLYVMYARRRDSYMELNYALVMKLADKVVAPEGDPAADQIIVKESFEPIEIGPNEWVGQGLHPAAREGKRYLPGARRALFIMANLGRNVKGTDEGWVYGTVRGEGQSVSSAGQVANCVECHATAPFGRLFGLSPSTVQRGRMGLP